MTEEKRKLGYLQIPTKGKDLLLAIQPSEWADFYLRPWILISLDLGKVSLGSLERVLHEGVESPQAAPIGPQRWLRCNQSRQWKMFSNNEL